MHGAETETENLGPEERGAEFFDFLVHLKMHGKLSAKDVCILSYWPRGAGVRGKGASFAVKPSHGRRLQREVRPQCWASPKPFKVISVKYQSLGCYAALWNAPCLAKEIAETPGFEKRLRDQVLVETGALSTKSTLS